MVLKNEIENKIRCTDIPARGRGVLETREAKLLDLWWAAQQQKKKATWKEERGGGG